MDFLSGIEIVDKSLWTKKNSGNSIPSYQIIRGWISANREMTKDSSARKLWVNATYRTEGKQLWDFVWQHEVNIICTNDIEMMQPTKRKWENEVKR